MSRKVTSVWNTKSYFHEYILEIFGSGHTRSTFTFSGTVNPIVFLNETISNDLNVLNRL